MKSHKKALRFFLGANSPQGFVSRFDKITDKTDGWRTLIIKGGPGSGKSTLMKKIADELKDEKLELIHCSSDFDSLDAVICPARKFAIADGTSPHAGVCKIIFRFCEPTVGVRYAIGMVAAVTRRGVFSASRRCVAHAATGGYFGLRQSNQSAQGGLTSNNLGSSSAPLTPYRY